METIGYIAPMTASEAREIFAELEPAAGEIARAIAIAMDPSGDLYTERMNDEVRRTAREALFGSLLVVSTGPRESFDDWAERAPYDTYTVDIEGSEHVERIAWHAAPVAERVIAATYHAERDAAIATLRRMAWGQVYHEVVVEDHSP